MPRNEERVVAEARSSPRLVPRRARRLARRGGIARWSRLVLLVVVAGCSDAAGARLAPGDAALPPAERVPLSAHFNPRLAPLGFNVQSATVLDIRDNEALPDGPYLDIYVRPNGEISPEAYLEGLVSVTKVFVPDVFETWPGLRGIQVCQESLRPLSADPTRDDAPLLATAVTLTRETAAAMDWDGMGLQELLEAQHTEAVLQIEVHDVIGAHSRWVETSAAAEAAVGEPARRPSRGYLGR